MSLDVLHRRRAEDRVHNVTQATASGMAVTDLETRFLDANPAYCEMTGFDRAELLATDVFAITPTEDREHFKNQVQQLATGALSSFIANKRYLKKKRGMVWARENVGLLRDEHGRPHRLVILSENISPQQQMEREHKLLVSVLENSSDFVGVVSFDHHILFMNRSGQRLAGLKSLKEAHQTSLLDYFPTEDHDYLLKTILPVMLEKGSWNGDARFKTLDAGKIVPVHVSFFIVPQDKSGRPSAFGCVARDITDKKIAEQAVLDWNRELEKRVRERTHELVRSKEALAQAEKLEALGRLSGGVAHDFNNLMTGILGITKDLQEQLGQHSPYHSDLEEVVKAADKASSLTRQLLAFGRRQVINQKVINLNAVIMDSSRFFDRISEEDIQIKPALDPTLGNVKMDQSQLEQIVINLMLNARDAMPNGGQINIQTSNVYLDEDYAKQHSDVSPGPYVGLSISDTGTGMPKDVQEKIFEPFYTTKAQGKGTGLGLATVYGIVKQNGGDISVHSELGHGTTFRVYLRRASETEHFFERRSPDRGSRLGGSEAILVVEDEDIVRHVVTRALKKNGYRVLEARNASEALACIEQARIDLLLTDVVMPGMNGQELAKIVQAKTPALPILFMSGHSKEIIHNRGIINPDVPFIEKSFSANALSRKVREVLDTAGKKHSNINS